MNSRERMLLACRNRPADRPPVWLMRQAGRYLPEYRAVRSEHTFWEMVRTPQLAAEVTLQPIRRFGMDAAILFCDILVVLDALGAKVSYGENGERGLAIDPLVREERDLAALRRCEPEKDFAYVAEAVKLLCQNLHPEVAVIGFAGAPLTLAAYLIEGGKTGDLANLRAMAQGQPTLYRRLLETIADVVVDLLALQVRAGVDVIQVFDTWSGKLTPEEYGDLALPYVRSVFGRLAPLNVPMMLYVRNAAGIVEAAATSGCTVLSIDPSLSLTEARHRLESRLPLAGNLDPAELVAPPDRIRSRVHAMIDGMRGLGYIVNVGQGLTPETPIEGVAALVDAVKEWRQ